MTTVTVISMLSTVVVTGVSSAYIHLRLGESLMTVCQFISLIRRLVKSVYYINKYVSPDLFTALFLT